MDFRKNDYIGTPPPSPSTSFDQQDQIDPHAMGTTDIQTKIAVEREASDKDSMSSGFDFTSYVPTFVRNAYDATAQVPILSSPLPQGQLPPFGMAERTLILQYYSNQVTSALAAKGITGKEANTILNALLKGKTLTNAKLAQLANEVNEGATASTIAKAFLPTTWKAHSVQPTDWTPTVDDSATIQNGGILSSTAVAETEQLQLVSNYNTLLETTQQATITVQQSLPENSSSRVGMAEFIAIISAALQNTQQTLQGLQIKDAEKDQATSAVKFDEINDRRKMTDQMKANMEESREKSARLGFVGKILKFAAPLLTLGAAVLTILTFGATAPLLVVSAIALGYSVLDSAFGITSKIVGGITNLISEAMPNATDLQKSIVKVALLVAVVVVLAVVVVASGGAAASGATQTVGQTIAQIAKPLAIQGIFVAIMSSNALPELIGAAVKQAGGTDKDSQIAEAVTVIVEMFAMLLAMILTLGKGGPKPTGTAANAASQSANEAAQSVANRVKAVIDRLVQTLKDVPSAAKNWFVNFGNMFKNLLTLSGFGSALIVAFQQSPNLINAMGGMYISYLLVQSAKITRETGNIQAAMDNYDETLNQLDEVIGNIQDSMKNRSSEMEAIGDTYTALFQGLQQTTNQIAQNIRG